MINVSELYFGAYNSVKPKVSGIIIADMDLMIASIAMANKCTLVTNNTRHFDRIDGLKLDNWAN